MSRVRSSSVNGSRFSCSLGTGGSACGMVIRPA
jgi:hypothetical protein